MLFPASSHLHRFGSFSPAQRRLLLAATGRVALARLGLWVLPLPRTRALISRFRFKARVRPEPDEVAWGVRSASRFVPHATCLVQAVAVQALIAEDDAPLLVVGVALSEDGEFQAHAWVECQGRIIIGETPLAQYQRLLVLDWAGHQLKGLAIEDNSRSS